MTKKIEKIAAVLLFFTMFIFINQLEVGVLPFFIAFSGVISCGSLSVIFFMRSFNLSFKLSLESTNEPVSSIKLMPLKFQKLSFHPKKGRIFKDSTFFAIYCTYNYIHLR